MISKKYGIMNNMNHQQWAVPVFPPKLYQYFHQSCTFGIPSKDIWLAYTTCDYLYSDPNLCYTGPNLIFTSRRKEHSKHSQPLIREEHDKTEPQGYKNTINE